MSDITVILNQGLNEFDRKERHHTRAMASVKDGVLVVTYRASGIQVNYPLANVHSWRVEPS